MLNKLAKTPGSFRPQQVHLIRSRLDLAIAKVEHNSYLYRAAQTNDLINQTKRMLDNHFSDDLDFVRSGDSNSISNLFQFENQLSLLNQKQKEYRDACDSHNKAKVALDEVRAFALQLQNEKTKANLKTNSPKTPLKVAMQQQLLNERALQQEPLNERPPQQATFDSEKLKDLRTRRMQAEKNLQTLTEDVGFVRTALNILKSRNVKRAKDMRLRDLRLLQEARIRVDFVKKRNLSTKA